MDSGPQQSCSLDAFHGEAFLRLAKASKDETKLRHENEKQGLQIVSLQEKVSKMEHEYESFRQLAAHEASQQEAAHRKLIEDFENIKELYSVLFSQNGALREQNRQLQEQYSACNADSEALRRENHSLSSELGAVQQRLADCQHIATIEASANERATKELQEHLEVSDSEIKKHKQETATEKALRQAAIGRATALSDQNRTLQTALESSRNELDSKQQQLEDLQRDSDTLNKYLQEYDEKSKEQQQLLTQQQAELEAEAVKSKGSQETMDELRAQLASLTAELEYRQEVTIERADKEFLPGVQMPPNVPTRELASAETQTEAEPTQASARQVGVQNAPPSGRRNRQESALGSDVLAATDFEIPAARRQLLDSFPEVQVPLRALQEPTVFNRIYLSGMLGGGMQGVIGTFAKNKPRTPLSIEFDLEGCIYPQRHLNPWLPHQPGTHGYLFLGLVGPAKDHTRFLTPILLALFICKKKTWEYYGQYIVHRVPEKDLTVEEWTALSGQFKDGDNGYCAMTLNKSVGGSSYSQLKKTSRSSHDQQVRQIRAKYDAGERRVPCISLQCVGYNEELVSALNGVRSRESQNTAQPTSGSGLRVVLKRKRSHEEEEEEEEEAEEDGQKLRRVQAISARSLPFTSFEERMS